MSDARVRPSVIISDRWEPVRCAQNKRVIDVNPYRKEVRWFCDRCRVTHIYRVV